MAFIDIKDPIKREETVKDYIRNIKEIQERRENEKVRGFTQRQDFAKMFQPVVQATEKSASQITNEIENLKGEVEPKIEPKAANQALDYYFTQFSKSKLDQYFGVYQENGIYMMGNKEIVVDDHNNIYLDDGAVTFKGTKGLWRLIMFKSPKGFETEDFDNYKELLERTNAINMPHAGAADRPRNTTKWRFFKANGLIEGEEPEENEGEEEEEEEEEEEDKKGFGIQFLPGDIKGLVEQLHLLFAEFQAGNKSSTRNQIVAILDQLLKRNYLTQDEYNGLCETISC